MQEILCKKHYTKNIMQELKSIAQKSIDLQFCFIIILIKEINFIFSLDLTIIILCCYLMFEI